MNDWKEEKGLRVVECAELPSEPDMETVYRLVPASRGNQFYGERTGRNAGWITSEEQDLLRKSKIAIAGCGGMGGVAAELLLRAGIGELHIADPELFDVSNIHRQIAAGINTTGTSKAFATARRLRSIADDNTLIIYPQGVTPDTVNHFVDDSDLVLDEVEAWAVFPRLVLHRESRKQKKEVINCNSLGAGTRLFLFTPESETMEDCLGVSYEEAHEFHCRLQGGIATMEDKRRIGEAVIDGLLPELPEYSPHDPNMSTQRNLRQRLLKEGKAMILASNPYGAASFMVTHSIFHLLRNSGIMRNILRPVPMPGYLYRDDLLGVIKTVKQRWY